MTSKQILFRLEPTIAAALEKKLTDKGISKQFLFAKLVDMFIHDQLSFDNNLILTTDDSNKITIDSSELAETIKKHYLNDLAELIASDNNLIASVSERLETNFLTKLKLNNDKSYQDDSNALVNNIEEPRIVEKETAELEEGISQGTITAEESYLPLTDDSRGEKSQEKADTVDSIDKPTHEGSIDINPELILSQRQLATRLGYKSHKSLSAKFKSLSKEDFIEWTKSKDPDRLGWYKQGKTFEIVE